jgi:hypothetical protein
MNYNDYLKAARKVVIIGVLIHVIIIAYLLVQEFTR